MKWETEITKLLGCKYPIIEGALTGLGTKNADFAAEVSKTGALGCITAHSYRTPEALKEAIKKHREVTPNPFMVNISIGLCGNPDEMLGACIEEKIPCLETSAFRPDDLAGKIKASGMKWIHKAATVKDVLHAEKLGADAVVLVGLDGYGFKSIRQLPTFTAIAYAAGLLKIPLIAAGGIANGRTMLAALMAGAEAVYIGSAFMATTECPIGKKIKENMFLAKPDHPGLIMEMLAPPDARAYGEIMSKRGEMPLNKWLINLEKVMLKHHDKKEDIIDGKSESEVMDALAASMADRPRGPFSFSCAYFDKEIPVRDFVEGMAAEAEKILKDKATQWQLGAD